MPAQPSSYGTSVIPTVAILVGQADHVRGPAFPEEKSGVVPGSAWFQGWSAQGVMYLYLQW